MLYEYQQRVWGYILEDKAKKNGNRTFLHFYGKEVSYAELDRECTLIAKGLLDLGVNKSDKICIMMDNQPEYVYCWLGANKIGAVEVSINTAYKGESLQYIIDNSDANTIFVNLQYLDVLEQILESLTKLRNIVVVPEENMHHFSLSGKNYSAACITYDELRNKGMKSDAIIPQVSPHDLAMLGYTSGTTGRSKGVMIPHHRLVCSADDVAGLRKVNKDEILYTCLPLFHGNAKNLTVLVALIGNGQIALGKRFSASRFWDEIREYGATQFNYLGVMTAILIKNPEKSDDKDQPAKIGFGAGCPATIHEAFERRFGIILQENYGSTETGSVLGIQPSERKIGSCGKAIFEYDVKLVDENDNEVPTGKIGEFCVLPKRPYSIMSGYYKLPEETLKAFRNLMLHTGDLGYRDEEGYFYFADRKKDAIRRRGENISSQEVEATIVKNENIMEAAVFPVPSEVSEDEVMAIIVLKKDRQLSPEDFFRYCNENMPYFWIPRYVEYSEEPLQKTSTGKIEKYKMKENGVTAKTIDLSQFNIKYKDRKGN